MICIFKLGIAWCDIIIQNAVIVRMHNNIYHFTETQHNIVRVNTYTRSYIHTVNIYINLTKLTTITTTAVIYIIKRSIDALL